MKRAFRFRFNKGSYFQAKDQRGEAYPTRWRSINTSRTFGTWESGNFGLVESINNFLWNLVGVPAPSTHFIHFRVVDGLREAPRGRSGQYEGDFWGLTLAVEPYDSRFFTAHQLPKGNLYKLTDGVYDGKEQQRYQSATAVGAAEDYENVASQNGLRPARPESWLREHVDWDSWFRYSAVCQAVRHYDYGVKPRHGKSNPSAALKNAVWYFAPQEGSRLGKLRILPYDSETSWGPVGGHRGWDLSAYAMVDPAEARDYEGGRRRKTALMIEWRNVIREFRDLVWTEESLFPVIDHFASVIADFAPADRDRWKDHPLSRGHRSDFGFAQK